MQESKAHIVLIEQYNHSEVVLGYIRLLAFMKYRVSLLAPEHIHLLMQQTEIADTYHGICTQKGENIDKYSHFLNSADLIIITTIEADFYNLMLNHVYTPKMAVIHSANFYFRDNIWLGICGAKAFIKRIELIVKGTFKKKNEWLQKMDGFIFGHDIVAAYVKDKYPQWHQKYLMAIPFSPFLEMGMTPKSGNDEIKIAVPGTISNRARDYVPVWQALQKLRETSEIKMVTISFLGKAVGHEGQHWAEKFQKLSTVNMKVKIYSDELSFEDYEKDLANADFLILPLKNQSCYYSSKEYLNESYFSGTVFDMIKVAKPSLMPAGFPLPGSINKLTLRYKDADELYKIMIEWIKNKSYNSLDRSGLIEEYSIKKITRRIDFGNILQSK